jgi:hypothetical protein
MVEERGELVIYQFEKKELYSWKLPVCSKHSSSFFSQ